MIGNPRKSSDCSLKRKFGNFEPGIGEERAPSSGRTPGGLGQVAGRFVSGLGLASAQVAGSRLGPTGGKVRFRMRQGLGQVAGRFVSGLGLASASSGGNRG